MEKFEEKDVNNWATEKKVAYYSEKMSILRQFLSQFKTVGTPSTITQSTNVNTNTREERSTSVVSTPPPTNTNVNVPVVSSQISTVGRTSNFYIQLIPPKPVEKFEPLPMSYVLMTNGRITLTGEFKIEPTKECQTRTVRTIRPEEQTVE